MQMFLYPRSFGRCPELSCTALAILLAAVCVRGAGAQTSSASQSSDQNSEAVAKAAARKKRFEEQKRRLEQSEGKSPSAIATLFISPAKAGMLVGETRYFSAFDIDGNDVTADVQWSSGDSSVGVFESPGEAMIRSETPGKTTIHATRGERDAEALVTVYTGDKMPSGEPVWVLPLIPGYHEIQIVKATGALGGPDMYATDQNDQGEKLLRALLSDGRQIWMRKLPVKNGSIKPSNLTNPPPRNPSASQRQH